MPEERVPWERRPSQRGPVFEARYSGRCDGCGDFFDAGTPIFMQDGETYIEDCCEGGNAPLVTAPPKGCQRCFLVHRKGQAACD